MCETLNLDNNLDNKANSALMRRRDLYSTSAEDNETVYYFFNFQETMLSPNSITKPLTGLLVWGQAAHFASSYPSID